MVSKEEIPDHWELQELQDFSSRLRSTTDPADSPNTKFEYYSIPYFDEGKGAQLVEGSEINSRKRELQGGELMISRLNPRKVRVWKVSESERPKIASTEFVALDLNDRIIQRDFLYYFLRSSLVTNSLINKVTASTKSRKRVPYNEVMSLKVPVPPLVEQEKIVEKLDDLFDNIEEIQDAQEEAEDKYDIAFNSTLRKYIPSKDSEVETVRFGDTGEIYGGGTPSKSKDEYWGGSIPWVSAKDMGNRKIEDSQDYITQEAYDSSSAAKNVPEGSIIFVMRSSILEHTFPVSLTGDQLTINQDLKALVPGENIHSEYLLYTLLRYEKQILQKCSKEGTTVASLDSDPLYDFRLPIPDLNKQREIVKNIEQIDERIEKVKTSVDAHNKLFEDLPKSVLVEAFKGNLVDFELTSLDEPIKEENEEVSYEVEGQKALEDI